MKKLIIILCLLLSSEIAMSQAIAYGLTPAIPVASPSGGSYTGTQSVTYTLPAGSYGCYTTDGSAPTVTLPSTCGGTGTHYTGAISVTTTKTLKTIACLAYQGCSPVSSDAYTISAGLAIRHSVQVGQSGSASTIVLPAMATSAADSLAVFVRIGDNTITALSVANTGGDTWNCYTPMGSNPAGNTAWCRAANANGNASDVITVTLTGACTFRAGFGYDISGSSSPSTPFDLTGTGTLADSGGSTGTTSTTATFSTSAANEIILTGVIADNVGLTFTAGTLGAGGITQDTLGMSAVEYQIVSMTQSSVAATTHWTGSQNWVTQTLSVK